MKKLMVALCAGLMGVLSAQADFFWSTWNREDIKGKDVQGCVLGLSSEVKSVQGAQVDICINRAKEVKSGAQWALFGYNRADKFRNGVQLAFWNDADSASLQLGLICHNKTSSFLPWFVFFNFDTHMFGKAK